MRPYSKTSGKIRSQKINGIDSGDNRVVNDHSGHALGKGFTVNSLSENSTKPAGCIRIASSCNVGLNQKAQC
jgi:hypothetical protein